MLRSLSEIYNYSIEAVDGEIGKVQDFLFDDNTAHIRYMVVRTGSWLLGKMVLLPPAVMGKPDWASETFSVKLTQDQVKNSPDINADLPVSREMESRLYAYYGWPSYWSFPPMREQHLRSTREVKNYRIHARDGRIGRIDDFIVDDEAWRIRYLVVETHEWLPGKKVIISPAWVKHIDWLQREAVVNHSRKEIENAPEYDPSAPVNRRYEEQVYDYYGRPKYWSKT